MAKPKLTLAEHYELGLQLKIARNLLSSVAGKIYKTQRKTAKATQKVHKAKETLDRLRSELDNIACGEHMDQDNGADKAYYGTFVTSFDQEANHITTIPTAQPVTLILKRGDEILFTTEFE